ncbi:hypothetical protein EZJ19_05730 [Parasulfuritortus cantonensis]|uniref:Winged helix-turn-helix domain-containing protein n=1 Tax=Parasulfuritortus cantonensis TaxID=2528202 RepID=A0A4R1BFY3_9PROT|nr:hypothetical protein [Parasulfuritortus cantonensis]TCJ16091.1 hypothetical protein EZJ19_05730 [Parasulfuritortus cantonensis]
MEQLHLNLEGVDERVARSVSAITNQYTPSIPPFSYPPAKSVYGRVLGILLEGYRPTHRDVQYRFSASRLAADVHKLRARGWPIHKMTISVLTRDHGRVSHVAQYWLSAAAIAQAGDIGRHYAQECRRVFHGNKAA